MEWHQLEYFCTVAQLQHFTRAAEQLSISQPALSRSIAKLEEELGISLFERQGKKVVLNRFGKTLLIRVERAKKEITEAKQEILDIIDPEHGTVSFAFLHSQGMHTVPNLIRGFRSENPNIQFKFFQNFSHLLLEQLKSGEIDLCLSPPVGDQKNIEWMPLFTEELFAVVASDHILAGRENIELAEISGEPLITLKNVSSLRNLTDKLFKEAGLTPNIEFEGEEFMTVTGLVEAKLGVAILPHLPMHDSMKLSFIPISQPNCFRTIGLSWTKEKYFSPAAKKFCKFVIGFFQGSPSL